MTELSHTILDKWQIRKSRKQKTAFIQFMQEQIPGLTVEKSLLARNLVLGDVKSAKVILTAHYDTCARLPFPNFISPKNFLLYLGYQLLIIIPIMILLWFLQFFLRWLGLDYASANRIAATVMMGLVLFLFMGPIANPHTANDNTSGMITLCEIWATLSPENREKVCFVFFDNEENGLLGSSVFASQHKKDGLKEKLVLNFDCVSDGDHILFAANRRALKQWGGAVTTAFQCSGSKTVELTAKAFYPSDQANFPVGIGVAALKRKKGIGLYMDRIHTIKDTVFMEDNIQFLTEGTATFLKHI